MKLNFNYLNFKNHPAIWDNLNKELEEYLQINIQLVFPDEWNHRYYGWFQDIEESAFRKDLRYSFKEVINRMNKKGLFFLFILFKSKPEALILGFSTMIESKKLFFLDTIAIKHQGRGIGKILLNYLIEWLKLEEYKGIYLYTEEINEKNFSLLEFYKKLGFNIRHKEDNGNIDMILWF